MSKTSPFLQEIVENMLDSGASENEIGEVVDTLTTTDTAGSDSSSSLQSSSGRIRFPNVGASNTTNANITLHFDTAASDALPNEKITIFGDLKITDVAPDGAEATTDEVINSFRLTFDIIPEII